jgi:hypothetical protein
MSTPRSGTAKVFRAGTSQYRAQSFAASGCRTAESGLLDAMGWVCGAEDAHEQLGAASV